MQLSTLIAPGLTSVDDGLDVAPPADLALSALEGLEICGITADSRQVHPGCLFVAIPGSRADGAKFVADAVAAGALAVLAGEGTAIAPLRVPVLRTLEPRRALALMAARFYDKQPDAIVAVTGTSGKTSVAEFCRQLFTVLGHQAASLGTIGLVKPDGAVYGSLTTPDPVALAKTLRELADEDVSHLALEASSHGLDQCRLDGARLTAGAFTNLGRDHLDYHNNIEDYFQAKLRLFTSLLDPRFASAVINADDARSADVIAAAKARGLNLITVGKHGETLRLADLSKDGFAQRLSVVHEGRLHSVRLKLIGDYQASNALVAAGLAMALGEDAGRAISALSALKGVKGRLEIVAEARGGLAVVDYAHKPEALQAMLAALRPFATGRLICVFGCGGDRDQGKRPIMGKIAAAGADLVIVTDDNPRSEEPAAVRAQILAGIAGAGTEAAAGDISKLTTEHVREIGDRAEAIKIGAGLLGAGDVLVVAGKGHETGQITGDKVVPFSDHEEILRHLA